MSHQRRFPAIQPGLRGGFAALIVSLALPVLAQQASPAQGNAIRQACRADYQANCAGVPTGGSAARACLEKNAGHTSPACCACPKTTAASMPTRWRLAR